MNQILRKLKSEFKDKKILIVGLGLQGGGVGLAKFLVKLGAKVKVTDKKTTEQLQESVDKLKKYPIEYTLGKHKLENFITCDIIFKGPSIPWDLPEILEAQKRNIPIEMETSFFMTHCPAKVIGITGTRGKSTTTMMIYELLKKSGVTCHLGGNIPQTLAVNLLEKIQPEDWVILELSSWQLSGFHRKKISPHIAVFTNLYPDHLNLYQNMDDYFYDKKAIYLYQKQADQLVVNVNLKSKILKDKIKSKIHFFSASQLQHHELHLGGAHNRENAAAALSVAKILKLDLLRSINILKSFKGLPFREQIIAERDGIIIINDTTSTTPTSTIKAIERFKQHQIVLILGGNSKNLPTNVLINQLINTYMIILLKGSFTDEILPILKEKFPEKITKVYDDFDQAVKAAYNECIHQSTINNQQLVVLLLSPAATSFSMFKNEFHRGEEFNRIAKLIINTKSQAQMTNQIQNPKSK